MEVAGPEVDMMRDKKKPPWKVPRADEPVLLVFVVRDPGCPGASPTLKNGDLTPSPELLSGELPKLSCGGGPGE